MSLSKQPEPAERNLQEESSLLVTSRMLSPWLLLAFAFLISCSIGDSRGSEARDLDLVEFKLGRDQQALVRVPAVNEGAGTTVSQVNVVFNKDELIRFLGLKRLPLSPRIMALLNDRNCYSDDLGGLFSLRISSGLNHTIRILNDRNRTIHYSHDPKPIDHFGLRDRGYPDWAPSLTHSELHLPDLGQPFGMMVTCGFLNDPDEGGCTFNRDFHKQVDVEYHMCERLLPYWRELDDLYFAIAQHIVIKPKLTPDYRIGYYRGL